MRLRFNNILSALTAVAALLLIASCSESPVDAPQPPAAPGASIRLTTGSMLPQVVTSRAAEAEEKTDEEQKINTVHIFFFDSEGNFLTPTKPEEFAPYVALDFTTGRPEALAVPSDAFVDQDAANVHIVAVANIHGSQFRTDWTPEGDIVNGDPEDAAKVVKVCTVNDLYRWVYRPAERKDISKLPTEGMPMVGELKNAHLKGYSAINVHLTALMARVDVKVHLNALQINADEGLPKLVVNGFGIKNLPKKVSLFNPDNARTATTDEEIITDEQIVEVKNPETLLSDQNAQTFTYYTYENLRDAQNAGFSYPEGVADDPAVHQRWKPQIADAHASTLVIHGVYTTHQNLTYRAQFTFYLGDNTVDNFEVRRNRCYKNDITVRGLDIVGNHDDNLYTFDARVNIATDNPVFISLVNERRIDSHWSVVPMDIYFLENAPEGSTVDVEILDPATSWIHLGYCDASLVADDDIKAGWGCADYFYEDMFTRYPETKATASHNRDRIYFYVDENASTTAREAHIKITYKPSRDESDSDGNSYSQTIEFLQAGLLPFTVSGTTYYMEAYEEYAEHRDPLDTHAPSPWYQPAGIPWAREGSKLAVQELGAKWYKIKSFAAIWKPYETTTSDGISMTTLFYFGYHYVYKPTSIFGGYIYNEDEYITATGARPVSDIKIYPTSNESIEGAVQYSFSKNKRNQSGLSESIKWFLPGISELESMLRAYSVNYPTFRSDFYWSASTAKNPNNSASISEERENWHRARATMIGSNGNTVSSGATGGSSTADGNRSKDISSSDDYPSGGRTLRTQPLRVRAIRVADGVTTN